MNARGRQSGIRAAPGVPPPQPGLRLHRLQAVEPGAPRQQADARRRASTATPIYIDYLEVHPEEFGRLFDTILINVTAFFRDPSAWEAIGDPGASRGSSAGSGPRTRSASGVPGCASGEEAYTPGHARWRRPSGIERVPRPGQDLRHRRRRGGPRRGRGRPSTAASEVAEHPAELLEKYFEANSGRYAFHKDLRRSVIFGRHDLIQDAPISRIDLLSCRNTLMYLNTETQARILERFHFALNERGFLFLGKAETLLTYNNTFIPVDLKRRIFAKVAQGQPPRSPAWSWRGPAARRRSTTWRRTSGIREAAFDASPVAQVVVDFGGTLTLANERARALFNLAPADLAPPLQDLQLSYRPVELRSCIDRAYAERQRRRPQGRRVVAPGRARPATSKSTSSRSWTPAASCSGASITFLDTTAAKRIADDHERSTRELETAYEELQSTNEELETTNEELQSTVEELETTSEELQSTNEELETMNEELQSTNEELETVNDELRRRSEELKRVNAFLRVDPGRACGAGSWSSTPTSWS